MKGRRVVAMVAAWVAVVALASSLAWFAIERAGREVLAGPAVGLDESAPSTGEPVDASVTPTASPTSTPTRTRTSTAKPSTASTSRPSSSAASGPRAIHRSAQVTGGSVGVRCTGSTAQLRYAQPASGWTVEVKDNGPQRVEVEFTTSERDTRVRAECAGGVPVIVSEPHGGGGGGGDDGGGDDGGGSGSSGSSGSGKG